MRATPRRERFPVEVQKSSELQALHRRNARLSTMRAPVPKEAWLAVERGPYLLGFREMGRGWTKHPRHETRPQTNPQKLPICRYFMEPTGIEPVTSCLQKRPGTSRVVSVEGKKRMNTRFAPSAVIVGRGCFPRALRPCFVPRKRVRARSMAGRRVSQGRTARPRGVRLACAHRRGASIAGRR